MDGNPIKSAALCLTHNCNLRCRYCYAGSKARRSMSLDTARQAVQFLASQASDGCTITFFGGEPLMELRFLTEVVRYSCESYDGRFEFRMATNGTMLSPETLKILEAHRIYFSLSLDGTPAQQDSNRVFPNGAGSYHQVAGNLENILASNPYTVAVSVITPATVDHLAEGVEHLSSLGFRYVMQTLDYTAEWTEKDIRRLRRQYQTLSRFYYDALKSGHKIYYSPFDGRIQTWAQKPYTKGELCDLANSQIAIAASGRIYPCVQFVAEDEAKEQQNAIGDVWNGFDTKRREWFIQQNHLETESCVGCALYGRCATYCGCVNWRATGYLNRIPPIICEHERMLMPIVDELANRLWKHNVDLFKRKFYEKSFPISSFIEDCLIARGGSHA